MWSRDPSCKGPINTAPAAKLLSWQQHNGYQFVSVVMHNTNNNPKMNSIITNYIFYEDLSKAKKKLAKRA